MILIENNEGLVGDFLGTIPAMQAIAAAMDPDTVYVRIHPEAEKLFKLIASWNLEQIVDPFLYSYNEICRLDTSKAFEIANQRNLYMTQAYMAQADLEVPTIPPKAQLLVSFEEVPKYDIILVPFARSLPADQKWVQIEWQKLVDCLPEVSFCVFGNSVHDPKGYIVGPNVTDEYDNDFNKVCNIMKQAQTVVSVVTGISHLAFHLGVHNILLTNQSMTWGNNPDATQIKTYIPDLKVYEVLDKINLVVK